MKHPLILTTITLFIILTTTFMSSASQKKLITYHEANQQPIDSSIITSTTEITASKTLTEKDNIMYRDVIYNTANMVGDKTVQNLTANYGLQVMNVTWEDTGRYYNSSVGPNISDVTIQVQHQNPDTEEYELTLMPVIRYPNFEDLTADISPDDFYLLVGNEKGEAVEKITLTEYLGNFRHYLTKPDSWKGEKNSLLAERDTRVLVSAQAAFLPIPQAGKAEFNPVIFNYQSYQNDPAVLVVLATREGTSATIIDNTRDAFPVGFSWGQRLFFNQHGERASFTGERLSDFQANTDINTVSDAAPQLADEAGLNMVLLIQIPLKQKISFEDMSFGAMPAEAEYAPLEEAVETSDVEAAVIGHGAVEGPFVEIDNLDIERDERFPIRVTVQFYKATSNGVVSPNDVAEIAAQIERVYAEADYVGSLVVGGESERPTEYDGPKNEPDDWWPSFWKRFQENTKLTQQQAIDILNSLNVTANPSQMTVLQRETNPTIDEAMLKALTNGNNTFAFNLYRELAQQAQDKPPENLFFSPYSISTALGMTYGGASSTTAQQMAQVLHYSLPQDKLHLTFNALDKSLNQSHVPVDERGFRLSVANSLWGQDDFPFKQDFLDLLALNYGSELQLVDFIDKQNREEARLAINRWVSDETEQKIQDILQPGILTKDSRLVLANAIYFKGDWATEFAETDTQEDSFTTLNGESVTVPMMYRQTPTLYKNEANYQVVELPYQGERIRMTLILPTIENFTEVEQSLTSEMVNQLTSDLVEQDIELFMPKFELESELSLNETLETMGMPEPFSPTADFSGMSDEPLYISNVIHKAYVGVDEGGTEATAATSVEIAFGSVIETPPSLQVWFDHPFILLIRDIETNTVLFIGRVLNPIG